MDDQRRLLLLASRVARLDADLGSQAAQAWLTAAIDSLAHALVDLSDGAAQATIAVALPTSTSTSSTNGPARDRGSCAAARAELVAVRLAVAEIGQDAPAESDLVENIHSCLVLLISALGETAGAGGRDQSGPSPNAHRNLRAAFRILQPARPLLR